MSFELEQLESKQMMSVTLADAVVKADLQIYIPTPTPIYVYGTAGNDSIYISQNATTGDITVNNNGAVSTYAGWLTSSVNVYTYDGNDYISGYGMSHQLNAYAGNGNDVVHGSNTDDYLYGEAGNDYIYGWAGNDYICGGTGNDSLYGYTGNDYIYGEDGDDKLFGQYDNDVIYGGNGNDEIRGGTGSDWLLGDAGNDKLWGEDGDDWIIGSDGNDQLFAGAGYDYMNGSAGDDTLVSIGGGQYDTLYGSSGFDSFWADSESTEYVADADYWEIANGNVHRVGGFMTQRFTHDSPWPWDWTYNGVSRELNGQNLADPVNGSNYQNFSSRPLFSTSGPVKDDIDQNGLGDCYFLATLGSIAKTDQNRIRQHIVDLGDGTYGVQFGSTYIRVDADLPTNGMGTLVYAGLGTGNSLWAALMEKAWAYYRHNDSNYLSTEYGWMDEVFSAMGSSTSTQDVDWWYKLWNNANDLWSYVSGQLGAGKAVTVGTPGDSANLVGSHAYMVDYVYTDWAGTRHVVVRNPWGGSSPYVDLTASQLYNSISRVQSAYV